MRQRTTLVLLFLAIFSVALVGNVDQAFGQNPGSERVFHAQKTDVENVIQSLHAALSGRIPIFDGFVEKAGELSDRYSRGYFELAVQTVAEGKETTRVRVTAKITAWYTDPAPAQSGYRVLSSNGRLEADLLDRIEEALAPKGQAASPPHASRPENPSPAMSSSTTEWPAIDRATRVRSGLGSGNANLLPSQPAGIAAPPATPENIEALRRQREEAEKRLNERKNEVQNLEEILANQSHPTDIAVVRKSGTRVLSKPSVGAAALFSADAEDEFQVLDSTPDWIHVQISGASRGWIRRAELDMPAGLGGSSKQSAGSAAPAEPAFRVVREETNPFQGSWEALKGKTVKVFWAEPTSAAAKTSSSGTKKEFAKSLFLKAYQEISTHDQTVAGVVIVFDSADGGQVAATFEDLKKWQAGALSESAFWQLCSVDPPEMIQLSAFAHGDRVIASLTTRAGFGASPEKAF